MITYISQLIVFVLALLGLFFKSTETDDEGKTVYSSHGIPYLTSAGKIVVLLLALSFTASMYSTYVGARDAENKEKANRDELANLRTQNDELEKDVRRTLAPIKGILLSYDLSVSLDEPELKSYRSRLKKGVDEYVQKSTFPVEEELAVPGNHPLFPQRGQETAFDYLNSMTVTLNIFKKPAGDKEFNKTDVADLTSTFNVYLSKQDDMPPKSVVVSEGGMIFNRFEPDSLSIRVGDISITPDRQSGRIASVQDLSEARLVISFGGYYLWEHFDKDIQLKSFFLNVSDGRQLVCTSLQKQPSNDLWEKANYSCILVFNE